jgi:predicted CopG family antitoxin
VERHRKNKIKIRREVLEAVEENTGNKIKIDKNDNFDNLSSYDNLDNSGNSNINNIKIPNFVFSPNKENNQFININKENENFESDDEDSHNNSRQNPNSLISISKEVYAYLKDMNESKGSHVTEYILKHLEKSQTNLSFKNIQRRVYDAINVMNAVGIIRKEKNNLLFRGGISNTCLGRAKNKNEKKNLKEKIKNKINSINSKQHELIGLCTKVS